MKNIVILFFAFYLIKLRFFISPILYFLPTGKKYNPIYLKK